MTAVPPPTPPRMPATRVKTREDLLYLLSVAAELEHGLSLQYLFAAFSLKTDLSEGGISQRQLVSVRKWKANILQVAAQEMLHLAQAANLATAVGGTAHLRRPNFPQPRGYYPTDLPWELAPFSDRTLRRFICYERPVHWDGAGFGCGGEADPGDAAEDADDLAPRALPAHSTIAELYGAVRLAFEDLDPPAGLFIGEPDAQVPAELVDFPQLRVVRSRSDARAAIDVIVEQGEGSSADRVDSHFGMFMTVLREYREMRAADPAFDPVRPVATNPLTAPRVDGARGRVALITDPYTRDVADLANAVYGLLVTALYRLFAGRDGDAWRRTLAQAALRAMTTVVAPLGEALARLPLGVEHPGRTAGAGFELWPHVELMAHERSAWVYMRERLAETAACAHRLAAHADAPPEVAAAAASLDALGRLVAAPGDGAPQLASAAGSREATWSR